MVYLYIWFVEQLYLRIYVFTGNLLEVPRGLVSVSQDVFYCSVGNGSFHVYLEYIGDCILSFVLELLTCKT